MEGGTVLIDGIIKMSHVISTFVNTIRNAREDMLQVHQQLGQLRRILHKVLNDVQPDDRAPEDLRDWVYSIINGCLAVNDDIHQTIQDHQNVPGLETWASNGKTKAVHWNQELEVYIGQLTLILNIADGSAPKGTNLEIAQTPYGYVSANEDTLAPWQDGEFLKSPTEEIPREVSETAPHHDQRGSPIPYSVTNGTWYELGGNSNPFSTRSGYSSAAPVNDCAPPRNNHMANESTAHQPQVLAMAQHPLSSEVKKHNNGDGKKTAVRDEFRKMAWEAASGAVTAPRAPKQQQTLVLGPNCTRPKRTKSAEQACREFQLRIQKTCTKDGVTKCSSGSQNPANLFVNKAAQVAQSPAQKYINWLKKDEFKTKIAEKVCMV